MPTELTSGLSGNFPANYSITATGELLIATGDSPVQRWDGITAASENAGIPAAVTCAASPTGTGTITGVYGFAVQFLDDEGIQGDFSPMVTFTAASDALVTYTNVPVSTDARVTKRRIWRTTAGQLITTYLDAEIDNNTATSATSSFTDTTLVLEFSKAILNPDGSLNARRFGVPPAFKKVVVSHQERTFWLVNSDVKQGHAEMTTATVTATIVGANVTASMVDQKLHIDGHSTVYNIDATSATAKTLTLGAAFSGPTNLFSSYSIRPVASERNQIYFSELAEPESVPSLNAIRLRQEEGDGSELTAGFSLASFQWLLSPSRIYRWSFQNHPVNDGAIYLTEHRGCLNQKTWVQVEGQVYVMDRDGIYKFGGGTANPISEIIQDMFRPGGIVWDNAENFHAAHYRAEETVKFFVCLDGNKHPKHALCYHYRRPGWWLEEYPWQISASGLARVGSRERLAVGSTSERLMLTSEGTLDGIKSAVKSRGAIASATQTSVTLTNIDFVATDAVLAPIQITKGRGKGQTRIIYKANATTGRLDLDREWSIIPDANSQFQIGGIDWLIKTKWFRYSEGVNETGRSIQVGFEPATTTASMDIRYSERFRGSVVPLSGGVVSEPGASGVLGEDDYEVDMLESVDGWNKRQFDGHSEYRGMHPRFVQAELRGVQNKDQVVVHNIDIDGVRK